MSELMKRANIVLIDDDSITISEQSRSDDKEKCIQTMTKLMRDQRYNNIVLYNETLMKIDRMKNDIIRACTRK